MVDFYSGHLLSHLDILQSMSIGYLGVCNFIEFILFSICNLYYVIMLSNLRIDERGK